ncbi:hypothetical protein [Dyella monticola]|uniref:hypothetical protein n=1 Tax=Dyella monticola TaxID=1927958 RepID=UPI0018AD307D|nr:hypothetical protein [Dyella monticola]
MPRRNVLHTSRLLLATGLAFAPLTFAQLTAPGPDFSGLWQLNDKQSDSAATITQRLHAEKRREQAPSSRPASASSSGTPSTTNSGFGGRGGGRGMGGGMGGMGGGHGGGRHGNQGSQDSSSDHSAPPKDPTPPLLTEDSFLNVQQNSSGLRVDFNNTDRLDTRFGGSVRQSLNSNARVQSQLTSNGMQISMSFDDGTHLDETWVRSPNGHHLTVTETWTTNDVREPIVFKRNYDRLDL